MEGGGRSGEAAVLSTEAATAAGNVRVAMPVTLAQSSVAKLARFSPAHPELRLDIALRRQNRSVPDVSMSCFRAVQRSGLQFSKKRMVTVRSLSRHVFRRLAAIIDGAAAPRTPPRLGAQHSLPDTHGIT